MAGSTAVAPAKPPRRPDMDVGSKPALGTLALASAILLLILCAFALNWSLGSVTESRTLVLQANAVLRQSAELQVDIRRAETGQRGYIITGDRRYLAPYEDARRRVWQDLEELERLVIDPEQQARLKQLRPLVQLKLDELVETVRLREQSFEAAMEVVRTDRGQQLMEDIEAVFRAFREEERTILSERTARLEGDVITTSQVAGLTSLLAVASAVFGAVWLGRQRGQARLLEAERRHRADLERQVAERTAELTEVNRELDAFAYTISHDLRAPVRSMHGFAEALLEDYGPVLPPEGQGFIRRIRAAALRMNQLIADVLTYSHLVRSEVTLRPVSLEALVDGVLGEAAGLIGEADANVAVERPLPAVLAHRPTLAQAVDNLVSNAVKFVGPGVKPEVVIRAERIGSKVRLVVEDNGIGIDPAHAERIFTPFERLHGIEAYPGTGIGLAIVRRSLERMGGTAGFEPRANGGSRFFLELTAAQEDQ